MKGRVFFFFFHFLGELENVLRSLGRGNVTIHTCAALPTPARRSGRSRSRSDGQRSPRGTWGPGWGGSCIPGMPTAHPGARCERSEPGFPWTPCRLRYGAGSQASEGAGGGPSLLLEHPQMFVATVGAGSPGAFAQEACAQSAAPSPGQGGSSAGTEPPARLGTPSLGRGSIWRRPARGCNWGRKPGVQAWRGSEGTGLSLGGCARPRIPGPGVLEVEAQAEALLPRLCLLASAPSDSRAPTFRGLQTHPGHSAPDFHLSAQQALFAGLHRYANPGAAPTLAWEARRGHGGVKGCACPGWAWGTTVWTARFARLILEGGGHVMPVPACLQPRSVDDEVGGIGPATTARPSRAYSLTREGTVCVGKSLARDWAPSLSDF